MGSINYRTGQFLTIGSPIFSESDFTPDELLEMEADGWTPAEVIESYYQDISDEAARIIDRFSFDHFKINIIPGYYDGFTVDISDYFDFYYEPDEKPDVMSEAADIVKMLYELADAGLVACSPGWVTGYSDYEQTRAKISDAADNIRDYIKTYPETYNDALALINGRRP